MKIAIISPSNIYCMPYYYKYERILGEENRSFDLIFWDRSGVEEKTAHFVNQIKFNKKSTYNDERVSKIFSFLSFAAFVKKTILKNNYDKLIFLGTYSLLTFFLTGFLKKYYKNNYLLDIRDYTYEKKKWFFQREEVLIKNASSVLISSDGYKEFLPKGEYNTFHNADFETINNYNANKQNRIKSSRIRISFIGNVRYYDENIKLLDCFKNDNRFIIQYFGSGSSVLKDYCQKKNIKNVKFLDRFNHNDTWKLYCETDVINNAYGNSGIELRTALSNKLYYAAAFDMPIIVSSDTYMEKISTKFGFGYVVDFNNKNLANDFFLWYNNFLKNNHGGKIFMDKVIIEEDAAIKIIKTYLN